MTTKEMGNVIMVFLCWVAFVLFSILLTLIIIERAEADDHTQRPANPVWLTTCTHQQLCTPGWTKTVRPPDYWTNALKRQWLPRGRSMDEFELDHNGPIVLCGAPRNPANLWLQEWPAARRKDVVENGAHKDFCAGRITLKQAQQRIEDWK